MLVRLCEPIVNQGLFQASFIMGGLVSILSNLFNNHPALMIGTITLTEMGLDPITLKTIYLANIIGSDMGSLLLPIGTLASLIWMSILRKNKIKSQLERLLERLVDRHPDRNNRNVDNCCISGYNCFCLIVS